MPASGGLRGSTALAVLLSSTTAASAQTPPVVPPAGAPAMEGSLSLELDIVAKELDVARQQIQPSVGAATYKFTQPAIRELPQGENQPFNQLLLQAPGVAQDAFGQVHLRGEHANLQFRLNGVILPEGINVFGQELETRVARSVSLITGALPAQYGLRTAGVVDIQTRSGAMEPGGSLTAYGGMRDWLQPSFAWGGRAGQVDYFLTGQFLHSDIGIENPASSFNALHDQTNRSQGFAYVSGAIDPASRLTAIIGASRGQFQIPNRPNTPVTSGLTVDGISDFNSALLNQNQRQITHYGILALQQKSEDFDFQVAAFTRYSSAYFTPDPLGDLLFDGIAQTAYRRSIASGTQGDASYPVTADHTLRFGYFVQGERSIFSTNASVLPVDAAGAQTSDQPLAIPDNGGKTGWLYGLYLQDEWKPFANLTVNFGARWDLVDEFTHEQQLSPRLNVVWQPVEGTTLHAGYARYFSPPRFALIANPTLALFADTSAAPAVTQNDPVKSERDHYFDLGGTQVVLPGLKIGLDLYYKIAKNLIDEGQFGAPVMLTAFNYARGFAEGVELTASYDVDNWSLYGNFALSKAMGEQIISGQFNFAPDELAYINSHFIHLDHDQTYTASAGVAYTIPGTKTRLSASLIYGSGLRASTTTPNGGSLPDYQQVNLSVVQKIDTGIFKGLEARLDVLNLLDQKYLLGNGTGVGVGAPKFGPRFTVLAGLTQHF